MSIWCVTIVTIPIVRGVQEISPNTTTQRQPSVIDEPPADTRRKTSWVRLIQKVYEVDRLECANSGATMRIIALIDDPATCGVFFIR